VGICGFSCAVSQRRYRFFLTGGLQRFPTTNALVGIDELLHGKDHLRGWGQDANSDRRLLFATGFDPASGEFKYRVNQHFGAAAGALNPFRIPFVLGVQGRLTLGQLKRR
jgi:hypothetical protein